MIKLIGYVALVVLALIVPLIIKSPFYLDALLSAYMYAILVLGFVLVWITGRLSLATAGFFAIGAYSSALMVMRLGLSFWLALPLAGIVAGIFGILIGSVIVRRGGITFIMLTWSFAEIIRLTIANQTSVLGGRVGLPGIPNPNPISLFGLGTIDFVSKVPYYYLILFLLLVAVLFLWRLYGTRFGMIFRSLSQSDRLAQSLGVDILKYRLLAFSIAAFFTGLAGSFYAHYITYLDPSFFTLMTSVNILVYAVIGGVFNFIAGPLVGTIFLVSVARLLTGMIIYELLIYSVGLIMVAFFLSGGLASLPRLLPGTKKLYKKVQLKQS